MPRHAPGARPGVPGSPFGREARCRRPLARARDRGDADPDRRGDLGDLPRRRPGGAPQLHAGRTDRRDGRRRHRFHPLHVRDDEGPEGRRPHPRLHLGAACAGDPLARRPRGRRRVVHGRIGLGEGDLEHPPRPVVARRGGRAPRGRVRSRGTDVAAAAARSHRALSGTDRVPDARQAGQAREHVPAEAPARRLRGRAAQPGGDHALPGRARPHDPRRIRPDGELAARRERARRANSPGLDGSSDPGARRRRHRRDGSRVPARGRGRPRADRASAHAVHRLLERPGRDRRGVQGGVVPDGRPGDARRGRIPVVRRTRGRRHRLRGVPDRPLRGRERPPRASRRCRERRRGRTGLRTGPDRQGVRCPPPRARARPAARRRAPGARQGGDGTVQVPASGLLPGGASEDNERKGAAQRAPPAPGRAP